VLTDIDATMRVLPARHGYGIYVIHMAPLGLLVGLLRPILLKTTHSKLLAVAGSGILSLGLCVAAAYQCFHLYEKPFLRLKRYFDYVPRPERRVFEEKSDDPAARLVNS
jgi:peptidoglycan/LPS O-acetylase OafA/YrhL